MDKPIEHNDIKTFSDLKLADPIQLAIKESGYTVPTDIQKAAIPYLLDERDLLGCAQTGTGKTAAFALPILELLHRRNKSVEGKRTRVLILTPTRELAIQINDSFKDYGKHLNLKSAVIYGGVPHPPQIRVLTRGLDILVATPGRLLDMISQRYLSLRSLDIFVLDEADRMLDMGFIHEIRKIIKMLPVQRQNLFFSATMPKDIRGLADTILLDPVVVEVAPVSSTVDIIDQSVLYVERKKKKSLLLHVLKDPAFKKVLVFTRTKRGANQVCQALETNRISSEAIHGNKSQSARQRALENFRKGKIRVLVATDLAARGIDVDNISLVINFEIPNISESYVHRIGRTARAGAGGSAMSFCDAEERAFIKDIEKVIGQSIPVMTEQPYHSIAVENARPLSKGKAKAMIEKTGNRQRRGRNGQRQKPSGPKSAATATTNSRRNKSKSPARTNR